MKRNLQTYLQHHYGEEGEGLFQRQQALYKECLAQIGDKTENQRKTMTNTILPRVALYKTLREKGLCAEESKDTVKDFMQFELAPFARTIRRMDRVLPFFFGLFRKLFLTGLRSDNWTTQIIQTQGDTFAFDIVNCLWYDTCSAYGCPELCTVFCDGDHYLYDDLSRTNFERTKTIATGDGRCDFRFIKRSK